MSRIEVSRHSRCLDDDRGEALDWHLAHELFISALQLDPTKRLAFLDQTVGDDPKLLATVRSLLQHAEASNSEWLSREIGANLAELFDADCPPYASATLWTLDRWVGRRLGPYRLEQSIGRGGMGAVFRAQREDGEFSHQVAIKVAGSPLDRELRRRFLVERQILARLDHPNICRLLDGGTSPEGHPYLVMEYLEGTSITRWCNARRLGVEARIALLLQVCEAVEYAHQHQVVHRDLKPGNIFVTSDGTVRLLDFGIAKLLRSEEHRTRSGLCLLTPEYASPEQFLGQAITPAADVWALGVLLHEMLIGHRPFENDVPEAVGPMFQHRFLGASPEHSLLPRDAFENSLRQRDLEAICSKALRGEPTERYTTAGRLGEDLRRHLAGQPIQALAGNRAYVVHKTLRRHRWRVLTLLGLLLAVGVALQTVWKAREQAQIAQSYGARAQEIEGKLRFIHMLPPHDIRQERQALIEKSTDFEAEARRRGGWALGPGLYAAGRLRQMLGEPGAVELLEQAWESGYQVDSVAAAIGLAQVERYRQRRNDALRATSVDERAERLASARRDSATSARYWLDRGVGSLLIPRAFGDALLAFVNGETVRARQLAEALSVEHPWFFEAALLRGDALYEEGALLAMEQGTDAALAVFQQAARSYEDAITIAPSAPQALHRLCDLQRGWLYSTRFDPGPNSPEEDFERAFDRCQQVWQIDPDHRGAHMAWTDLLLLRGRYAADHGEDPWSWFEQADAQVRKVLASGRGRVKDPEALLLRVAVLDGWSAARSQQGLDPNEGIALGLGLAKALPRDLPRDSRLRTLRLRSSLHRTRAEYLYRHQAYRCRPDLDAWGEILQEILPLLSDSPRRQAAVFNELGDYFRMRGDLTRDVRRDGESPLEFWRQAVEVLQKAAALEPESALAPFGQLWVADRASHYALSRELDPTPWHALALEVGARALASKPDFAAAHFRLGKIHHHRARRLIFLGKNPGSAIDRSLHHLHRSLEIEPRAVVWLNIAIAHRQLAVSETQAIESRWQALEHSHAALDAASELDPEMRWIQNQRVLNHIVSVRLAIDAGLDPGPWIERGLETLERTNGWRRTRDRAMLAHLEAEATLRRGQDPEALWRKAEDLYEEAWTAGSDWAVVPVRFVDIALERSRWALASGQAAERVRPFLAEAEFRLDRLTADFGEIPSARRLRIELTALNDAVVRDELRGLSKSS